MKVKVLVFAHIKEIVGSEVIEMDLPDEPRGSEIISKLVDDYPDISPQKHSLMLSMNGEYIGWDDLLIANSEIAVLTPVSGG
ncbi:MAG: MoaD/ThiS family protein [Deltaproteobacteria bacterium]|nr:MoaD/ThiS family protein [Deltaproteobacteria bacterium]